MGWSLLDIWVQPLNRRVNATGLMPAGSRHVWIQTDDLDAQGTIIGPLYLNDPHMIPPSNRAAWVKGHIQSALPACVLLTA